MKNNWKWKRDDSAITVERWYPCGDLPCREAVNFYPEEKLIVISEYGKRYDDYAVARFQCLTFEQATMFVESVLSVETH